MPNKFPIPDFSAMAEQLLNNIAPEIAEEAKSFFIGSFDKGGFTDYGFAAWPKRKDQEPHKILFKSDALKDSIHIKSQTPYGNCMGTDVHTHGYTMKVSGRAIYPYHQRRASPGV